MLLFNLVTDGLYLLEDVAIVRGWRLLVLMLVMGLLQKFRLTHTLVTFLGLRQQHGNLHLETIIVRVRNSSSIMLLQIFKIKPKEQMYCRIPLKSPYYKHYCMRCAHCTRFAPCRDVINVSGWCGLGMESPQNDCFSIHLMLEAMKQHRSRNYLLWLCAVIVISRAHVRSKLVGMKPVFLCLDRTLPPTITVFLIWEKYLRKYCMMLFHTNFNT